MGDIIIGIIKRDIIILFPYTLSLKSSDKNKPASVSTVTAINKMTKVTRREFQNRESNNTFWMLLNPINEGGFGLFKNHLKKTNRKEKISG